MLEQIYHLFSKIDAQHLNILFLLGIALFGGTIGGRLFQRLRIPQVVGYIAIGILIGHSGLRIIDDPTVKMLQPINAFALGLIGFMIGGELKSDVFKEYGRQFLYILLFEGVMAFVIVTLLVGAVGSFFFHDARTLWALALLLGAISVSTAPATTTSVLWEYKTRGPLTTTAIGIVAMDDGLGLLIFAFASSIAGSIIGMSGGSAILSIITPFYEVGIALILGVLFGLIICDMLRRPYAEDRILAFSIGAILLLVGLAVAIDVDMIFASMMLGVVVVNFSFKKSKVVFKLVEKFTPPIYVLFFVLVGAKLNIGGLNYFTGLLVVLYLTGRTVGKLIGANLGARLSYAPETVRKYLPLCLLSQAGVAIGLSIFAGQKFPGEIGNAIIIIITGTTFLVEIIGPPFVKLAVEKAGEVGLNITEEDLIKESKARDIMYTDMPYFYENTHISEILKVFSESDRLHFPVINNEKENKLSGIITIGSIKNTLLTPELNNFLIAADIMDPVVATAASDTPVDEVRNILHEHYLEYLPVVSKDNVILGFIERRAIKQLISQKIIEMQKRLTTSKRIDSEKG